MALIESQITYPPVSAEEIAFAIAIFVNAANRTISPRHSSPHRSRARRACDQAFLDLVSRSSVQTQSATSEEAPLYEAFRTLWEQFEGDNQQASVCARILAFHFLMERTRGAVVEEWLKEHPETPETVVLDDAIVAAIANTALAADGSLLETEFLASVRNHVQERAEAEHSVSMVATRDLAAQLLTLEAQAAAGGNGDLAVASQICQKLRLCLIAVVGREAYRTLLTRALTMATKEEASLASVRVREDGTLEGTEAGSAQAGQVLIARFVELQTTFVGEALLYNLLRELWPALSFGGVPTGSPEQATPLGSRPSS